MRAHATMYKNNLLVQIVSSRIHVNGMVYQQPRLTLATSAHTLGLMVTR